MITGEDGMLGTDASVSSPLILDGQKEEMRATDVLRSIQVAEADVIGCRAQGEHLTILWCEVHSCKLYVPCDTACAAADERRRVLWWLGARTRVTH